MFTKKEQHDAIAFSVWELTLTDTHDPLLSPMLSSGGAWSQRRQKLRLPVSPPNKYRYYIGQHIIQRSSLAIGLLICDVWIVNIEISIHGVFACAHRKPYLTCMIQSSFPFLLSTEVVLFRCESQDILISSPAGNCLKVICKSFFVFHGVPSTS